MATALTGTPGTGKSAVASLLRLRGSRVLDAEVLARRAGALRGYDEDRDSQEVDVECLGGIALEPDVSVVGHLSHWFDVQRIVVLRTHPDVLRRRLTRRGWGAEKVAENLEAEALGVVTAEALGRADTYELDTTQAAPSETVARLLRVLDGEGEAFRAPWVDWTEVILAWY